MAVTAPPADRRWRTTAILAAVALGLGVLGTALLGLPGAVWVQGAVELLGLFSYPLPPGDAVWPLALMITFIWPWFLPAFHLLASFLVAPGALRWVLTLGLTALTSQAMTLAWVASLGR